MQRSPWRVDDDPGHGNEANECFAHIGTLEQVLEPMKA